MAPSALPAWLAVFGLLTYHVTSVYGDGPFCYSCDRISRAQDCDKIVQCSSNEKCFSQRFIGSNLHEFYKLGCTDKDLCQQKSFSLFGLSAFPGPLGRKRKTTEDAHALSRRQSQDEMVLCLQCCDGEYCNQNLCGSFSTTNLRRCFECGNVEHPNDCDKVVECGHDHFCYVHLGPAHVTFDYRYDLGCMPKRQCTAAAHAYQNTGCMACCDDRDYCNYNACENYTAPIITTSTSKPIATQGTIGASTTASPPPTIVLVPGPTAQAQYGHNVFAKCITDPGVTVTWGFNDSALPQGARTDDKGGLWIDHITEKAVGVYKCVAVAPSGSLASKQIVVKIPQVPAIALYVIKEPSTGLTHNQAFNLTCNVAGYPVPTVSWTFEDRNGNTTIPGAVKYSMDDRVLTIDHYVPKHNDGDYTCQATNSYGSSFTKIHIP